jgi:hypothetical protein
VLLLHRSVDGVPRIGAITGVAVTAPRTHGLLARFRAKTARLQAEPQLLMLVAATKSKPPVVSPHLCRCRQRLAGAMSASDQRSRVAGGGLG